MKRHMPCGHAAGHPEFNRATIEAIVDARLVKHTMGERDKSASAESYEKLDPAQDFALLQRLCTSHLRK